MLLSNYQLYKVYEQVLPIAVPLLEALRLKRYHVQADVLVKTPDGAAISAIDFLKRHYRYNKKAQHYLLTGPYTHGTAQGVPRSHNKTICSTLKK